MTLGFSHEALGVPFLGSPLPCTRYADGRNVGPYLKLRFRRQVHASCFRHLGSCNLREDSFCEFFGKVQEPMSLEQGSGVEASTAIIRILR